MEPGSQWYPVTGQEALGTNWNTKKICLNMRKTFFPVRMVRHWNRLLREVLESLSILLVIIKQS